MSTTLAKCWMVAACGAAVVLAGWSGRADEPGAAERSPDPAEPRSDWPIPFDPDARRVYFEDYESGECPRIRPGSSAAVVGRDDGADVRSGKYCLRGNFDPKTVDPITKKQAASRYARLADISLSQAGVKDRMYVSYWWRLDPTNQFAAEPPGNFGGQKHAYITGSAEPWKLKVNCVVGQAWGPTHWWIVNNSPDSDSLRYAGNARLDAERGRLGVWRRIEFYLRMNSAPRERDGIALLKVDGELCIDMRDVPFSHSVPQTWNSMALPSMFGGGTPPRESFGWQLDDLEIWDGLPDPGQRALAERP
jgi:hypothetical protein